MNNNEITYSDYSQLPLALNADQIAAVLGISRNTAYNLIRTESFPKLCVGKRYVVPKEQFLIWLHKNISGVA